jgi:hypothetical protein
MVGRIWWLRPVNIRNFNKKKIFLFYFGNIRLAIEASRKSPIRINVG